MNLASRSRSSVGPVDGFARVSDSRKRWVAYRCSAVQFDGPFVAGTTLSGRIVPTAVDAEVAASQKPYEGMVFQFLVDRIEPMRVLSFRWHPYAVDPTVDYSKEPPTLVVFELEEVTGGTMLTVTESGFDKISLERRAKAFAANEKGWSEQVKLIGKYLALHAKG